MADDFPTLRLAEDKNSVLVAQVTDTHLEAAVGGRLAGMDTDASLALVIDMLGAAPQRPDLLLVTGDLASHASEPAYRRLRETLDGLGIPWAWIPGNHDDPAVMQTVLSDGKPMCRRVMLPGWQILLLDSTERGQVGGTLGEAELSLLDAMLAAEPGRRALLCMHHQPVPVNCAWIDEQRISDADRLFQIIDSHRQVHTLLWGHVHQLFDNERNGVRLLATPSTCIQFRPGCEDFALDELAPGLRWLTLHADGQLDSTVQRVEDFSLGFDRDSAGYL